MKTSQKSIFAAIATLFVAQFSYAEEPANAPKKKSFAVGVYASANAEKMNLTIENNSPKPLTVLLKDNAGKVLYSETLTKTTPKYWRKFDVSELGSQDFKVEVSNGTETISQDFNSVVPEVTNPAIALGMYQIQDSQRMNLLIENQGNKSAELRLKSEDGSVLYSETISKNIKKYSRKFNLANLTDGNYSFEVQSGTDKVIKEMSITTKNGQQVAINE